MEWEHVGMGSEGPSVSTEGVLSQDGASEAYLHIADQVYTVVTAIITVLGLAGNTLTLAVMTRQSLRQSSVSVFLSALAVSDSLVLLLNFLNTWLVKTLGIHLLSQSAAFCKLHRFTFTSVYIFSSWMVVAVSLQRLLVIMYPITAKVITNVTNCRAVLVIVTVVILAIDLYKLWAWDLDNNDVCNMRPKYAHFVSTAGVWIDGTLYAYIPICILLMSNGLIVYQLTLATRRRAVMTRTGMTVQASERREQKISQMVVVICTCFILLTAPVSLYYILVFALGQFMYESPAMALTEVIINLLGTCNYAINVLLYTLVSEGFRAELAALLHCGPRRDSAPTGDPSSLQSDNTEKRTLNDI